MISKPLKIGVGGPVGSGKTALVEALCTRLKPAYQLAVITNDIYTREDAEFLTRRGVLSPERIVGVETGGCPHTAIREDASVNLEASSALMRRFPDLDILFIESGGDNLTLTFSPAPAIAFVVPPVETSSMPWPANARANSTRPVLSETDNKARVTRRGWSVMGKILCQKGAFAQARGRDSRASRWCSIQSRQSRE